MRRYTTAFLGLLLLGASARAGDPWKEKSYKDWDEKDVRKVLNESPWVKIVRVDARWLGIGDDSGRIPEVVPGRQAPTGGGYPGAGMPGAPEQAPAGPSELPGQGATPQATFFIRWASSRTVRAATVRAAALRGAAAPGDAEKYLAQEPAEYQVIVVGPDMTPFIQSEDASLKAKTYLQARKSKQRVAPSRLEIQRAGDGRRIVAVIFYFAKKNEAGQPAIPVDEKNIEFSCQAGSVLLKSNFEPQKMADKQGVDL